MAALLVIAGISLYLGLRSRLDSVVDEGLESRAALLARQEGLELGNRGSPAAFAQIVSRDGKLLETDGFADQPLLSPAEASRLRQPATLHKPLANEDDERARLYAAPDGDRIMVAGTSLEERDDALNTVLGLLLGGGPAVLLAVGFAAWMLSGAALKPVKRMARQSSAISEGDLSSRLEVPETGDEIAELGHSLNEMLSRLEQAFEKERRFVDDASHELRTPLAILRTELELAMKGTRTHAELLQAVTSAAEEAGKVSRLAEDLLFLARSDRGKVALNLESIAAQDLLEGAVKPYRRTAKELGIPLQVTAQPGLEVRVDREAAGRALGNLIANAIQHSASGAGISVTALRDDSTSGVVLAVTDGGSGFPEGFVDRAFDPFARSDFGRSRAKGGTGLGLAIVKGVVTAHGGRVSARNLPDGGAEVKLVLPPEGEA